MSKTKDLEKEIKNLKEENKKLKLTSDLYKFLADQRAESVNRLLKQENERLRDNLTYGNPELVKKAVERIDVDNKKYDELQQFLIKNFPGILKPIETNDKPHTPNREELSSTAIGENGKIYQPKHIIDVAIIIMGHLKKQINDILGNDDFSDKNDDIL